ncbi:PsiF family protein [Tahibacter caeni]|uniref:PsiF family protein n=1 Tax=Tahibacter caeni TaxID=1453545 RepID=UPI0021474A43|nr:PsiF family protein [Tahibacter caeni]
MSSIHRSSVVCFSIAAVLAFAGAAPAFAADQAKTLTPQQQRMSDCNAKAAGKKGDERKTFMSACLKGESETTAQQTQQEKMKSCNADASKKSLKGDERKAFMSTCLKGDGAAAAAAH